MRQPDTSTPARRSAVGIENTIRNDLIETAVLIAADGKHIVIRKGVANQVHLTVAELFKAAGATFTHNHPDGFGPSLEDVLIAAQFGMKEIRVVTREFRFGVLMLQPSHVPALKKFFNVEEAGAMKTARDDVIRGKLNPNDFGHETRHRTWLRLASSLGFDYWKEQS